MEGPHLRVSCSIEIFSMSADMDWQTASFMHESILYLKTANYEIVIRDEPIYTPNSAENKITFDIVHWLDTKEAYVSSKHSVTVNFPIGESRSSILLAGGLSGIHENSALIHEGKLLVAVGNFVCCLLVPELRMEWRTKIDWATCFGIFHSPKHECYISHGECEITRLSYSGEIVWQKEGKDIFTGDFILHEDFISVVDFNDENYRIDINEGV